MKVSAKAATIVLLIFSLCITLAGCSSGPTRAVDTALKALKARDAEATQEAIINETDANAIISGGAEPSTGDITRSSEQEEVFSAFFDKLADFDYSIRGETQVGDDATVTVAFKTYDFVPLVHGWISDYYTQVVTAIYANPEIDLESFQQLQADISAETLQTNMPLLGEKTLETIASIDCRKTEDGWKVVEIRQDAWDAIFGGLPSAVVDTEAKMRERLGL